jgi:hypothetical protein
MPAPPRISSAPQRASNPLGAWHFFTLPLATLFYSTMDTKQTDPDQARLANNPPESRVLAILGFIVSFSTSERSRVETSKATKPMVPHMVPIQPKKMHAGTGGNEPGWYRFSAGSSTAFFASASETPLSGAQANQVRARYCPAEQGPEAAATPAWTFRRFRGAALAAAASLARDAA